MRFAGSGDPRFSRTALSASEGRGATVLERSFFQGTDVVVDYTTGRYDERFSFSRPSIGTYFDSLGNLQTAAANVPRFGYEPSEVVVRTNMLLYSEQFDNAIWDKIDSTLTVDGVTPPLDPVFISRAERLNETLTQGYHRAAQTVTLVTNATYTFSIWIRPQGRNWAYLEVRTKDGAYPGCYFNIPGSGAGAVGTAFGGAVGTIEGPFFATYFRCSITVNAQSGALPTYVAVMPALGDGQRLYTGTGTTTGLAIWGAQLELGPKATAYIPTTSAAATVTEPAPLKGLLIERNTTNAIRNSAATGYTVGVIGSGGAMPTNWAAFANTGWTYEVVGGGSQNGIPYVDVRVSGTSTTATNCQIGFDGTTAIVAAPGNTFTASAFVSLVGGSLAGTQIQLYLRHATSTAVLTGYDLGPMLDLTPAPPPRLPRYAYTATISAAGTERTAGGVRINIAAASTIDLTLRVGLPQVEGTHHATSPILTTGAAASRSADTVSMSGVSGLQSGAGTMVSEYIPAGYISGTSSFVAALDDGTTANRAIQFLQTGVPYGAVTQGGVNQASNLTAGTDPVVPGRPYAQAMSFRSNSFAVAVNGRWGLTDSSGTVPTNFTQLSLGSQFAANYTTLYMKRFMYSDQAVDQGTLAVLSIPPGSGIVALAYPLPVTTPDPVVATTALAQNYSFSAAPVATPAPVIAQAVMSQQMVLLPVSLSTGLPVAGTTTLAQRHLLSTTALSTGVPVAAPAALSQNHALSGLWLYTPNPIAGTASLSVIQALAATPVDVGTPVIAAPVLTQGHVLATASLTALAPVVPAGQMVQNHSLSPLAATTGQPVVAPTSLAQGYVLSAADLATGLPVADPAELGYASELSGIGVVTPRPVLGPVDLVEDHGLVAVPITVLQPTAGSPAAAATTGLSTPALMTGAPVVGSPSIAQRHVTAAVPVIAGTPVLQFAQAFNSGTDYSFATHTLWTPRAQVGSPLFTQHQALVADSAVGEVAVLERAALKQEQAFQPLAVTAGVPVGGTTSATEVIPFSAAPVATAVPVVGRPAAFWQEQHLGNGRLIASQPVAGKPAVFQHQVLQAVPLVGSAPAVPRALTGEGYLLTALPAVTGAPTVGEPALQPMQPLAAGRIVTGRPVVGRPSLASTHYIYASPFIASAPVAGSPILNGRPGVAAPRHRPGTAAPRGMATPRVA